MQDQIQIASIADILSLMEERFNTRNSTFDIYSGRFFINSQKDRLIYGDGIIEWGQKTTPNQRRREGMGIIDSIEQDVPAYVLIRRHFNANQLINESRVFDVLADDQYGLLMDFSSTGIMQYFSVQTNSGAHTRNIIEVIKSEKTKRELAAMRRKGLEEHAGFAGLIYEFKKRR